MASRDIQRFEQVVLPHLDDAYTFARYYLRDEHDAQDVVQEAVLRALRHFEGYRDGDARAWLLAIVRNCCLSWQRRRRAEGDVLAFDDSTEHAQDAHAHTDALAIHGSDRALLGRAIAELPAEFREVIVLREIEELSYREISDVTGVPMGTVMSRLARARERLARTLRGAREAG